MILSILLGYIPAFVYAGFVYWLDRYEKEPLPLLGGVFMWGALVAAAGVRAGAVLSAPGWQSRRRIEMRASTIAMYG